MGVRTLTANPIDDARCELGEGPIWHDGTLHWVDILGRRLHSLGGEPLPTDGQPGCLVFDALGRSVVGFEDGVYIDDGGWRPVAVLDPDPTTRLNDGKVAPDGRLVVGSIVENQADRRGSLWVVAPDGSVETLLGGISVSNGLGFVDGAMWYIDTPSRKVRRFAWPPPLGEATATVRIPPAWGFPDGMCVDHAGCLWVAHWDGSAVRRYTPDGDLDAVVELPTPRVTSCAFGDDTTLYITTASVGRPDDPAAGRTYAVDVGISGPGPVPFGTARG